MKKNHVFPLILFQQECLNKNRTKIGIYKWGIITLFIGNPSKRCIISEHSHRPAGLTQTMFRELAIPLLPPSIESWRHVFMIKLFPFMVLSFWKSLYIFADPLTRLQKTILWWVIIPARMPFGWIISFWRNLLLTTSSIMTGIVTLPNPCIFVIQLMTREILFNVPQRSALSHTFTHNTLVYKHQWSYLQKYSMIWKTMGQHDYIK